MRRIKQLEGALGRKTLENEILKEAVDFAKAKKWIVRSPVLPGDGAIRVVFMTLGVSRSNVIPRKPVQLIGLI